MQNSPNSRMTPARNHKRHNPWLNLLGLNRKMTLKPEDFDPSPEPGAELLSVAEATLNWWEKHKDETVMLEGQRRFRYELKPTFVTQAQEVIKRLDRRNTGRVPSYFPNGSTVTA